MPTTLEREKRVSGAGAGRPERGEGGCGNSVAFAFKFCSSSSWMAPKEPRTLLPYRPVLISEY